MLITFESWGVCFENYEYILTPINNKSSFINLDVQKCSHIQENPDTCRPSQFLHFNPIFGFQI